MKIVFLSFYSGRVFRGVETFVHEVSNRLVELGHEVTVYQWGKKLEGSKYKTVTISITIDWLQKKGNDTPYINYYSLKIKEFTSKVLNQIGRETDIMIPTNGQWQSLLCSIWCKLRGKKIFISGHSGPGRDDKLNLWTFPNMFSAMTEYQMSWATNANPFIKVQKVPNGVDIKTFHSGRDSLNIKLQKPIILVVAAFDKWKRVDLAINAVSKLDKGSLLLVGKGPEENKLRELGEKELGERFKILSLEYKDMPKAYRSADIFTYPTVRWESFGIVLLEAMASGLPVVATEDPIRREIVGDAGLFVDPTDVDAYTKALQKALDTDWGNKPRKQAEKFDWDSIALKYENLFKSLL